MSRQVVFTRLPMTMPCPVPVVAGTGDVDHVCPNCGGNYTGQGQCHLCEGVGRYPIPVNQRTETCCVDAWWMIGSQVTCDIHLRSACLYMGVDYDGMLWEAAERRAGSYQDVGAEEIVEGWRNAEKVPWTERQRHAQDAVRVPREAA